MKKSLLAVIFFPLLMFAQEIPKLTDNMAIKLSEKPLHCINQEYPNKTAHIINNANEVSLSPKALHPAFYGCFDWHSSVHGHWMLVRILKTKPNLAIAKDIENILDHSFNKENLQAESELFLQISAGRKLRAYLRLGMAMKLDEELAGWDSPKAKSGTETQTSNG
ncbi:DUF2891 domain-containing protein [Flavobacterium sp. B17]|uniref:DUF2891 domain-containing protein n=1 Tax=Flavobacterium sp. B17 TaxID=95618 RepID=UPI00034B7994|nr:DUF2891 domain-containing protein [Flavobacterium sp. B17]